MTDSTPDKGGNKKSGRYIKRTDPLRTVLSVSDFSLAEISVHPMAVPDNIKGSIIHRALHNASDSQMGIKGEGEVVKDLSPDQKRPILRPIDFTEDWKKQKQRMSSRRGKLDEDDEFELELDILNQKPAGSSEEDDEDDEEFEAANVNAPPAEAPAERPHEGILRIQKESVDAATKVLNDETAAEAPMPANPEKIDPAEQKQFVPMRAALGQNLDNPEMEAIKNYQEQLVDREKIIEEAKNQGYQDGFKVGEEKAALQAKQQIRALSEELERVLHELEGLKKNVLLNAEENFQVLCQALMESVMRREFEINPGAFAAVVERAIQEAVPDDQFKIHVHPETFDAVNRFFSEKLTGRLFANKNITKGDFRIESSMTVVDGNITQLIRDLLQQADLSLFQQSKGKAS